MNTQLNTHKPSLQWQKIGSLLLTLALLSLIFGNPTSISAEKSGIRVGLILQNGSSPFNDVSVQGLMRAEKQLGIIESVYVPTDWDHETSVRQCVADGNALCLSVAFFTAEATIKVAGEYPQVAFAIIDWGNDEGLDNLRSIWFDHRQAGYLAGIVAGKMTSTNKLGVVAGMEIPPVVEFSEGFRNAAQCVNPNVEVQIVYTGVFDNPELGAQVAEEMVNDGADTIFNVAGATGNGAIIHATELGAYAVGVDTDQYITLFLHEGFPNNDLVLTSAMKNVDVGVYGTIEDFVKGRFTAGIIAYDLSNNGINIAPFHELSDEIPLTVYQTVNKTRDQIFKGNVDLYNTCR